MSVCVCECVNSVEWREGWCNYNIIELSKYRHMHSFTHLNNYLYLDMRFSLICTFFDVRFLNHQAHVSIDFTESIKLRNFHIIGGRGSIYNISGNEPQNRSGNDLPRGGSTGVTSGGDFMLTKINRDRILFSLFFSIW